MVLERDKYLCWHCSESEAISIKHRQNRGMGGSKTKDTMNNLIVLCSKLNFLIEADTKMAELARSKGWKLNSWDSLETPLFDNNVNSWFYLDAQGNRQKLNSKLHF